MMKRAAIRHYYNFFVFIVLASLDNAAAGVIPPLYAIIARDLNAPEAAVGAVTAVYLLVAALSAILFAYLGDQNRRRQVLLVGTILWATAMISTGYANTFVGFLGWQTATAVGVGAISSVGFSVISDMIPSQRRGLSLSLWSMAQLIGAALGALLAGTLGAYNWRLPFWIIAGAGFLFAALYLFTAEPQRGQSEPELRALFRRGGTYQYLIDSTVWKQIWQRRTNRWLMGQSFLSALALGSTLWVPRWAIARVEAEGYPLETATVVGNLFVMLFNAGVFLAIPAGHLGDRWQQRYAQGRTHLSAAGLLGSVPFFVLLFFLPLRGVILPADGSVLSLAWAVMISVFTNGWVILAFVVAFTAVALFAIDGPNWAALLTEVNLPEHRATMIGLTRLLRALGNAISVAAAGFLFTGLAETYPPPTNFALGLALFQLVMLPAGLCYLGAGRSVATDINHIRQTLSRRATQYTAD